jgi:hypothetical protein
MRDRVRGAGFGGPGRALGGFPPAAPGVPGIALTLLLAVAFPGAAAAQTFEGVVNQRSVVLGPQQVALVSGAPLGARPDPDALFGAPAERLEANPTFLLETSISFKGTKIRMAVPSLPGVPAEMAALMGDAYMLIDVTEGEMTTVMPSVRRGIVMAQESMSDMMAGAVTDSALAAANAAAGGPVTRELGRAIINGIETVGYESTAEGRVMRVWVAPSLVGLKETMKGFTSSMMPSTDPAMIRRAFDAGPFGSGYPVRIQMLTPVSEEQAAQLGAGWTFTWTESSVEEKPLDASLFEVPEGIDVVRMPRR